MITPPAAAAESPLALLRALFISAVNDPQNLHKNKSTSSG